MRSRGPEEEEGGGEEEGTACVALDLCEGCGGGGGGVALVPWLVRCRTSDDREWLVEESPPEAPPQEHRVQERSGGLPLILHLHNPNRGDWGSQGGEAPLATTPAITIASGICEKHTQIHRHSQNATATHWHDAAHPITGDGWWMRHASHR